LRAGISRGRLCPSILVIPRRKMALVRAFHGRRPWPDLTSWKEAKGACQRGREGEGEGEEAGGAARGTMGGLLGVP
jgi:hypothetical protein